MLTCGNCTSSPWGRAGPWGWPGRSRQGRRGRKRSRGRSSTSGRSAPTEHQFIHFKLGKQKAVSRLSQELPGPDRCAGDGGELEELAEDEPGVVAPVEAAAAEDAVAEVLQKE